MALTNEKITLFGNKVTVTGAPLKVGQMLPHFTLTGNDLADLSSDSFKHKVLIISVLGSLDTPVCSIQTKHFNQELSKLPQDVVVLTVSRDLPFAQKRWCGAEGATKVVTASDYKHRTFGPAFGTEVVESALLARAVFVADKKGVIQHVEYVDEITTEPDYSKALAVAQELAR
jgi:thiol peroxidase